MCNKEAIKKKFEEEVGELNEDDCEVLQNTIDFENSFEKMKVLL